LLGVVNDVIDISKSGNKRDAVQQLECSDLSFARVLVVDDMKTNLHVAAGLLGKYKMQVDCVLSGKEAVERIRQGGSTGESLYDAIFMDHMMPEMDGIQTAAAIRCLGTEYAKKIPIIALTANAIHGSAEFFYEHGFQAFIPKPIDINQLDSVVQKWVHKKAAEQEAPDKSISAGSHESEDIIIDIPGMDAKKAIVLYGGDLAIYLNILRVYSNKMPATLDKIRNVTAETLNDYVIIVHGVKGTSASVGALAVSKTAGKLETLAKAGDLDGVLASNGSFIREAEKNIEDIKKWLESYSSGA